jgi:probable HAF family extracellular repeat protein
MFKLWLFALMLTQVRADLVYVTTDTLNRKRGAMVGTPRLAPTLLSLSVLALSALIAAAAHASFIPLGVVDGLKVNGSSADGVYIVGQYLDVSGDSIAMRWDITGTDPLEDLGELTTGGIQSEAHDASGDGSVVVGDSRVEDPNNPTKDVQEAFRWEGGVMTGLGFLEDPTVKFESVATAVSDDGLVVAGRSRVVDPNAANKSVQEAFIWEGGVMTGLGFLADDGNDYESEALDISGDGLVVVGRAKNTDPNDATKSVEEAFVWEAGVMTGLGFLQDDTDKVESEATAASYDGSTLVGTSKVDDPNNPAKSAKQAFIWQGGVMTGLGFLADAAGPFESQATGVSADGSVVVGESKTAAGKEAFVWTSASNEMRSLRDVIEEDLGVDLTGWTLDQPPVMSSDGGTLIALATNPDGDVEAFVSYVPEPTGGVYPGFAMLVWLGRRRSARLKRAAAATH